MKIKIINDNGSETIINDVLIYDCFTKDDIKNALDVFDEKFDSTKVNKICKETEKKLNSLEFFPTTDDFQKIVEEAKCNY